MEKSERKKSIYETKGVFGDESKYQSSSRRFNKILQIVENLRAKPSRILDLGCGTGLMSKRILDIYPDSKVYGLDVSKKAVMLGKKRYKEIHFVIGDVEGTLPFESNFFDLVISGEVIEHVKDTDVYLEEINRILKKGGYFILSTPNLASWYNRLLLLFGRQPFLAEPSLRIQIPVVTLFGIGFPDSALFPAGHLRLFTVDILKKLLNLYNFKVLKVVGVGNLNKRFFKEVDEFFSKVVGLSSNIIFVCKKN
ncbi:hypothetical protein COV24_01040 [candidate division WWE3 bacterium CG10_big_fil_rev_8_21_14_0_10_32_10]|uniref:Methyltransferase type 11 domain-containing protein n=1 Tax=candidate division WWE3 bacterium CG10_big_fil_rev_8_21_14_0_10_32_10 TaxID=1975090 RepID=A0A2H0RBG8_UNCKA|nr:MAG: hypothetical protein COV24_01040 [candidate division WWE3 bacterium CG10_big_fil_rev_8_21_14_0_10_32_10]